MAKKDQASGTPLLTSKDGVLQIGEARAVLLTESAFVLMQKVIHEQTPEILKYAVYEMGYRAGLDLAKKESVMPGASEEAFRVFVSTYREAGYGDLEVVSFDSSKPEAVLRGHNLFETSAARRAGIHRTPRAVDHYTRGMCAGLFSQLLGKEVICEELECEHRGDDACEFVVLAFGGGEGA